MFCRISYHFRLISLFVHFEPVFRTFMWYLTAFCSRPEWAVDAISGRFMGPLVLAKRVKFHDSGLDWIWFKFHPKPSEAVYSTVFPYNFRTEVDNDVISGIAVDNVGVDVTIKFADSSSNGFRAIRGADFVSNERTWAKPVPIARNASAFRLKTDRYYSKHSKNRYVFIRCSPSSVAMAIAAGPWSFQKCFDHAQVAEWLINISSIIYWNLFRFGKVI